MLQNLINVDGYVYAGPQPGFQLPEDIYSNHVILGVEKGAFDFDVGELNGHAVFGDIVICPPNVVLKRRTPNEITFHMIRFTVPEEVEDSFLRPPVGKITIHDVARLSSTYTYLRKTELKYGVSSPILNHLVADLLFLCDVEKNPLLIVKSRLTPACRKQRESFTRMCSASLACTKLRPVSESSSLSLQGGFRQHMAWLLWNLLPVCDWRRPSGCCWKQMTPWNRLRSNVGMRTAPT